MNKNRKYNNLTPDEERVIIHKGTEALNSGIYNKHSKKGVYVCKQCNAPLFNSNDKFESQCGWPSFDDNISDAVKRIPDADGRRTEIVCKNCNGHLGHVFEGERFTDKNVRHCVNSISLKFIADSDITKTETAYFAGGCFWGMEFYYKETEGVISTSVGYMGGHKDNPTYKEVCNGTTSHAEALEVIFDPSKVSYEQLTKLFYEIHDPTQLNRQGPDVGRQYRSAIFYLNDEQKKTAENLTKLLIEKGFDVKTELSLANKFWTAEDYHQSYYEKTKGTPYCHIYQKKF